MPKLSLELKPQLEMKRTHFRLTEEEKAAFVAFVGDHEKSQQYYLRKYVRELTKDYRNKVD